MAQDFYANDPRIQGLLAATQAVEPMTQEAVPSAAADYLAGLDFSGFSGITTSDPSLGGFGLGMTPGYVVPGGASKLITAPVSNKGNPTAYGGNNQFAMMPGHFVRLVDRSTNTVLFEGTGFEAAQKAVEMGQNLTDTMGRKADYQIETGNTRDNYQPVASEKFNKSTLGKIADVVGTVAPLALSFIPGYAGLDLLTKVGAAAGAGGLGAALKGDDILKGALLGGATAGIVGGTGLDKAIGGALGGVSGGAAQGVAQAGGQAAGQAAGDIVVTGLSKGLQAAGGALGQAILSQAGNAGLSQVTGGDTPYDGITVTGPQLASGSGLPFGAAFPVPVGAMLSGALAPTQPLPQQQPTTTRPEDIVVTGMQQPVIPAEALAAIPAIGGVLAATGGGASNVVNGIDQATGDIVVSAPQAVAPPPIIPGIGAALPAITAGALTPAQTAGVTSPDKGGVLGTGLNIPQILSIGGIGADLLKSLLAGGGTGAGTPYVSPFGPGAGIGAGQDMRANPNITDYERYGFGPEAMFFQPEYSLLASGGASPQAQSAMPTNSIYRPLI